MKAKVSLGARTLVTPTPVWVIAAYDATDRPNVMTASWAGICCSNPPCVGVSIRPSRHTFSCIQKHGAFTVNVPSVHHAREADFFGIVSGKTVDKLAATGLTAVPARTVHAPLIAEFPLALECRVLQTTELGSHVHVIGEIMDVVADSTVLDERGLPDPELVRPFVFMPGASRYHALGTLLGAGYELGRDLVRTD